MFSHKVQIQTDKIEAYLENIPLPKTHQWTNNKLWRYYIWRESVSVKFMENNKSPGNDGLSKEF